ncbi:MAG: hypothetical protein KC621_04170, partial [Myxococcales bacterium]|nr:hypothetical protein [Myxococcales bacterium]
MVLLTLTALAARCAEKATPAEVAALIANAEKSFADRDQAAVGAYAGAAQEAAACATAPLPPVDVARLYIVLGLTAFLAKDRDATQAWFQSARGAFPEQALPDDSLAENHPVRQLYAGVSSTPVGGRIPRPAEGWVVVDGEPNGARPLGRTWLFQRVDGAGQVVDARWMGPSDPLPRYEHRAHTRLAVLAGGLHYPNASGVRAMGSLAAQVTTRLVGPIDLDAGLSANHFGRGWVPAARLGGRMWLREGRVVPFAGIVANITLHGDDGDEANGEHLVVRPILGVPLGARVDVGRIDLEAELQPGVGKSHDGLTTHVFTRLQVGA